MLLGARLEVSAAATPAAGTHGVGVGLVVPAAVVVPDVRVGISGGP